ncbi:metallophosphoesterase [Lichenibacterium ramalinae]|uniref:Metallophosphoesterase n=2 Tax=Lichenibacterium ramalinae TaxID=2316527 RepID=A0A4V1RI11_9HYPH|nr:metallophosphoesterase [Lichenibacterium ramalinae]
MCDRPFADVAAMDEGLISIWNSVVGRKDTVWHLGDFALGPKGTAERVFRRLNGSKHLIVGNHDGDDVKRCAWASVHDMASQRVDGVKLVLCHYPMLSWPGSSYNGQHHVSGQPATVTSIMCHGHVHGTPSNSRLPHQDAFRIDVGVDMQSMAPVAAEAVVAGVRATMRAGSL